MLLWTSSRGIKSSKWYISWHMYSVRIISSHIFCTISLLKLTILTFYSVRSEFYICWIFVFTSCSTFQKDSWKVIDRYGSIYRVKNYSAAFIVFLKVLCLWRTVPFPIWCSVWLVRFQFALIRSSYHAIGITIGVGMPTITLPNYRQDFDPSLVYLARLTISWSSRERQLRNNKVAWANFDIFYKNVIYALMLAIRFTLHRLGVLL